MHYGNDLRLKITSACVCVYVCVCAHLSRGCYRNSFIPITMRVRIRWWWLVWRRLPWKSLSPFSKDYPRWHRTLDNACGGTEGLAVSLIRNIEGGRWAICRKKWTHFSPGPRTGTLLSGCRDFKAKSCAGGFRRAVYRQNMLEARTDLSVGPVHQI